ncbi:Hypothetical protein PBC10988_12260 [Planctomycetales bacterium 10988]|nr:Hypothetical protein PBC10988_12260 [Planctomycetales bacterium 10988]
MELTGKYAEARANYTLLAAEYPIEGLLGQVRCLLARGNREASLELFEQADQQNFASIEIDLALAEINYISGKLNKAEALTEKILKTDPLNIKAQWLKIRLLRDTGKLEEADSLARRIQQQYEQQPFQEVEQLHTYHLILNDYLLRHPQSELFKFLVNDLKQQQLERNPNYWPALVAAGNLYLKKFNKPEAVRHFQQALSINPNAVSAYTSLAEVYLLDFDLDEAKRQLDRAIEISPLDLAVNLSLTEIDLANFRTQDALERLNKIKERYPTSEALLGKIAACYVLLESRPEQPSTNALELMESVESRNPHCGEFYYSLASTLDRRRRYFDSEPYFRKANECQPNRADILADLGLLLMRMGNEEEAAEVLNRAFQLDPFHVRVHNMLQVIETLAFYKTLETEHFFIRYRGTSDEILARYAGVYLEEIYPELAKQFQYEVDSKVLIEIFSQKGKTPGHGWFSARMAGIPYISTVGACAGQVVAITSPSEVPYNWSRVLKHELIHVINLQQTRFNLPHWLAEGIAVDNEGYPRPPEWNALLKQRYRSNSLFNLESINFGFIRPQGKSDWLMAYCQSELYFQFIKENFGEKTPGKLLNALYLNLDTPEAIHEVFHISEDEFDQNFQNYLEKIIQNESSYEFDYGDQNYAKLLRLKTERPDDPLVATQLANLYLKTKRYQEARELLIHALQTKPSFPFAQYLLARIELAEGDVSAAVIRLNKTVGEDKPYPEAVQLLAAIYLKQKQYQKAEECYRWAQSHHSNDPLWARQLARVYLMSGNQQKLAHALETIASLDADDFLTRKKLAQLAILQKDYSQAAKWAREAIYVKLTDPEVHLWLGQAEYELEHWQMAELAWESAAKLTPETEMLTIALARVYIKLNKNNRAKEKLNKILREDPTHLTANNLLREIEP